MQTHLLLCLQLVQKEDIKVIRKRVMGETHLKQINVEDEEGNRIDITYCLHKLITIENVLKRMKIH
jgi:hypothetical protein